MRKKFAVIYKQEVIRVFNTRDLAYRWLIRCGWEWDDRAWVEPIP